MFDNASITCRRCSRPYADQGIKKPEALQLPVHSCGRWDLNPHVLSDTRSLVLPVCQFQHSRATRCILAQRKAVGNNFFSFFVFISGILSFPVTKGVRPHLWHRYVGALSTMGSDPLASRKFMATAGVRPPGLLLLLLFFYSRFSSELGLAGLDVLLNGLLRAFVDGTALLTAEGLHQAYVVGV